MEQNQENVTANKEMTWDKMERKIAKEIKESEEDSQEPNFTTELFHAFKKETWKWVLVTCTAITVLGGILAYQITVNQKNNEKWIELFSSYDYVSQDGNGQNDYNAVSAATSIMAWKIEGARHE